MLKVTAFTITKYTKQNSKKILFWSWKIEGKGFQILNENPLKSQKSCKASLMHFATKIFPGMFESEDFEIIPVLEKKV